MRFSISFLFLLALMCGDYSPASKSAPALKRPVNKVLSDIAVLLVDKEQKLARLQTMSENMTGDQVVRTFQVAIGEQTGDKQIEGDSKTPEGIYLIAKPFAIRNRSLREKKYGPYAIPIDYPNPIDKIQGKTGYGIWFHGAGQDARIEKAQVTKGCVAFYNADIELLASMLTPSNSLVVIGNGFEEINLHKERLALKEAFDSWVQAWKTRNLDQYISFYSDDFRFKEKDLKAYRHYKSLVFGRYKSIELNVNKTRFLTHPKYGVSLMNQHFRGDDLFESRGRKVLYWQKDELGKWKIAHERFQSAVFGSGN